MRRHTDTRTHTHTLAETTACTRHIYYLTVTFGICILNSNGILLLAATLLSPLILITAFALLIINERNPEPKPKLEPERDLDSNISLTAIYILILLINRIVPTFTHRCWS